MWDRPRLDRMEAAISYRDRISYDNVGIYPLALSRKDLKTSVLVRASHMTIAGMLVCTSITEELLTPL